MHSLLALDGLRTPAWVAAAVCIVPCLFIIIIFFIVEIASGYYLEPSLLTRAPSSTLMKYFACLCIMGVFSAAGKDAVSIAVRTANCVRLCSTPPAPLVPFCTTEPEAVVPAL